MYPSLCCERPVIWVDRSTVQTRRMNWVPCLQLLRTKVNLHCAAQCLSLHCRQSGFWFVCFEVSLARWSSRYIMCWDPLHWSGRLFGGDWLGEYVALPRIFEGHSMWRVCSVGITVLCGSGEGFHNVQISKKRKSSRLLRSTKYVSSIGCVGLGRWSSSML